MSKVQELVPGKSDTVAEVDSDSYDDEEELLEPRFKYERVDGKDAKKMLDTEIATCIAAHEKLIAIGTNSGRVWIMDHQGHVDHDHLPVLRPHRMGVTRLLIDQRGNYLMSCANDCCVVIAGIGTKDLNYAVHLQFIPRAIAIHPLFSCPDSTPMFVVAERNVILYEKALMRYGEKTIFRGGENDGFIYRSSCLSSYIAFTNNTGTRIYDRSLKCLISQVNPSHDVDLIRSSRCPPSHCWLSDSSLAIGWADTVSIIAIITDDGEKPNKRTEVHYSWHIGMSCSGISTIIDSSGSWREIVVFGLKSDNETEDTDSCHEPSVVSIGSVVTYTNVQICVLAPKSRSDFTLLAEDYLRFNVERSLQPNHLHLAGIPSCEVYFLMGPNDLVVAYPYCVADAVKWRAENGFLDEAWELAKDRGAELEDGKWDTRTVGRALINDLLESGRTHLAVTRLKEVCGDSRAEWEWAVGVFERARLCTLLAEILPTTNPQLEPECYESVLHAAMYNDVSLFKKLVQQWSPDLYRIGSLAGFTLLRIKEMSTSEKSKDELLLYHALAHLYVYERKFEQAIKIYMVLKDQQIFAVIDKYQLFDLVKDQISELMAINTDRALRLLLDNEYSVPASEVMTKIARHPKLQMAYLTKLLNKNEGIEFADQAVRLYAEYDRKKLLSFLRKNENYHISRAFEVCRQRNYVEEMIILLGKSGKHLDALDLMLKKYNQLDKAIEYCKEHDDSDLWAYLIDEVVKTPEHIAQLLNQAGSSLDPLRVIEKIPLNMSIPGLRDFLTKVLRDYALRVQLQCGFRESTLCDARVLLSAYLSSHALAVSVGLRAKCSICGVRALIDRRGDELRVFGCGHVAHTQCCLEAERKMLLEYVSCAACSESTRDEIAS